MLGWILVIIILLGITYTLEEILKVLRKTHKTMKEGDK